MGYRENFKFNKRRPKGKQLDKYAKMYGLKRKWWLFETDNQLRKRIIKLKNEIKSEIL